MWGSWELFRNLSHFPLPRRYLIGWVLVGRNLEMLKRANTRILVLNLGEICVLGHVHCPPMGQIGFRSSLSFLEAEK